MVNAFVPEFSYVMLRKTRIRTWFWWVGEVCWSTLSLIPCGPCLWYWEKSLGQMTIELVGFVLIMHTYIHLFFCLEKISSMKWSNASGTESTYWISRYECILLPARVY